MKMAITNSSLFMKHTCKKSCGIQVVVIFLYMSVPLTDKTRNAKMLFIQLFTFYKHMQTTPPHYPNIWQQVFTNMKNMSSFKLNTCDQSEDDIHFLSFKHPHKKITCSDFLFLLQPVSVMRNL